VFVFDGISGAGNTPKPSNPSELFDTRTELGVFLSVIAHGKPEGTEDIGGRRYLRFSQTEEGKTVRIWADAEKTFPLRVGDSESISEYSLLKGLPESWDAQLFDTKNLSNQFLKYLSRE
jgi:hypothetical protein